MKTMQYHEALAFIHGAYGKGKKIGLSNMVALLERLGNPQRRFQSVHVAGTNGKGSVCAFLQAALRCAGYRTGLYTSPFLQRYNERIRVDGVPIADGDLAGVTSRVAEAVQALRAEDILPTEFEIGTAVAFTYFAQAGLDIAVIEVGLGGRIDPTNVIAPLLTMIASIGFDHVRVLGDTPEAIALEKAGIAKKGVPMVLSGQNPPSVQSVVAQKCRDVGAPFSLAQPAKDLPLGLAGPHQAYNAGVAMAALNLLKGMGYERLTQHAITEGLRRARWPGRLEWMHGIPSMLLDGAHNAQGVQSLAAYVRSLPPRHTTLIAGVMRDKDWQSMTETLGGIADTVIVTEPDSPRALPAGELAGAFAAHGFDPIITHSLNEAIDAAKKRGDCQGRVVIAGSLYLVGEARTLLLGAEDTLLAPA